jgi:hypothetical protein
MKTLVAKIGSSVNDESRQTADEDFSLGAVLDKLPETFGADWRGIEWLCAHRNAVVLYGSCARGDARSTSDIDLLVVDELSRRSIRLPDRFSVTSYTPASLQRMARRGSLFVLHLKLEGKVLIDRDNVISPILNSWAEPDYPHLRENMNAAVSMLEVASNSLSMSELKRISLFVLRSVLYAECARRGEPSFALATVAAVLNDWRVSVLFEKIRTLSADDIVKQGSVLMRDYLGPPLKTPKGGLEALAVNWSRPYPMASHLAVQLITGRRDIGYTTGPVDWLSI